MNGLVSIVGAGPGDPGLLTLRGAERLREADVIVYDALVREETLELGPPGARRIFVGKRGGCGGGIAQSRVNRLLARLGRLALRVVRLKGGDPFLFGRGAEEAEALAAAGVLWEVIPGVSSCLAAPAAAGIPVTDRRVSSMLTVVTGHACAADGGGVDWERLSPKGTLVVMMGLAALPDICARLLDAGWPAGTPAAVVSCAGWPEESTLVCDLAGLPAAARLQPPAAPAVIVVGQVVKMRERLRVLQTALAGRS